MENLARQPTVLTTPHSYSCLKLPLVMMLSITINNLYTHSIFEAVFSNRPWLPMELDSTQKHSETPQRRFVLPDIQPQEKRCEIFIIPPHTSLSSLKNPPAAPTIGAIFFLHKGRHALIPVRLLSLAVGTINRGSCGDSLA